MLDARHDAGLTRILTMSSSDLLGLIAATLTTLSFVPQAIKSVRTRDLSGISLGMYAAFTLGIALWLVYGLMTQAMPVIVANAVTLPLCGLILVLKLLEAGRTAHKGPSEQRAVEPRENLPRGDRES